MPETIVVVGAGQVAAQTVDALRREGSTARLIVIGAERYPPYQRPPLSKKFLTGELAQERLALKPESFYAAHNVELRLGRRAVALDARAHRVTLDDGAAVDYDRLLLATGSVPRRVNVPGKDLTGVFLLRTLDDVRGIRGELAAARRVVIVGAGYIGLEVAASCRHLGHEVEVIEMADRVMNRVVGPEVSAFYQRVHQSEGVRIHVSTPLSGFAGDAQGHVREVLTGDGRRIAADLVVIGVGVAPDTALAEQAGLACDNGIAVDEYCRTSDPDVFAAGDCTSHPSARYGRRVRLESVDNAFEQAKSAAANLMRKPQVHDKVPWFWSDQYALKLLIVGLSQGYDRTVVRGSPDSNSFSYCYLKDGELIAIDCINQPKDYMVARKLIGERVRLDADRLADSSLALKDLIVQPA
jgi:3-phenylpropionate/trans-cinnamate dioxygenase ferredoxin reductase component